ncbi:MAG: hypothetical protein O3A73_05460, partial [Proteobacteria bacterium]|nr:hypothetical protein [Pseudomonadota bacterium]
GQLGVNYPWTLEKRVFILPILADGGIIGLDGNANVVYSFNSAGMYRASVDKNGKLSVAIYK